MNNESSPQQSMFKKTIIAVSSCASSLDQEDVGATPEMNFTKIKAEVVALGAQFARMCFTFDCTIN
jgi:hypothetical protein